MKLKINAHARDCFWVSVGGWEHDGYLPDFVANALGYGSGRDDLDLEIDTETGVITNWDPSKFKFEPAFEVRITNALNLERKYNDEMWEQGVEEKDGIIKIETKFEDWVKDREQFEDLLTLENYKAIKDYLETYEVNINWKLKFWETYKTILDKETVREALEDHNSKIGLSQLIDEIFSYHGSFSATCTKHTCQELIDYLKRLISINGKVPDNLMKSFVEYYFVVVNQKSGINSYYVYKKYPEILHWLYQEIPEMFYDFNSPYVEGTAANNFGWLNSFVSGFTDKSPKYFEQQGEFISYDMKFKGRRELDVDLLPIHNAKPTFENFLMSYNFLLGSGDNKRALEKIELIVEDKFSENAFEQLIDRYLELETKFKLYCSLDFSKLIETLIEREFIKPNREYVEQLYNKKRELYIKHFQETTQRTGIETIDNIMKTKLEGRLLEIVK